MGKSKHCHFNPKHCRAKALLHAQLIVFSPPLRGPREIHQCGGRGQSPLWKSCGGVLTQLFRTQCSYSIISVERRAMTTSNEVQAGLWICLPGVESYNNTSYNALCSDGTMSMGNGINTRDYNTGTQGSRESSGKPNLNHRNTRATPEPTFSDPVRLNTIDPSRLIHTRNVRSHISSLDRERCSGGLGGSP